ncbi:MAG: TadE family protein [Candidatus Sulfotelmatobacter sp.]
MIDLREKFVRLFVNDTRAAEIAEAAAVLPLMFMMLLGIFWFGQAFSLYGAITRAAQEGARAGAAPPCTTCGTTVTNTLLATQAATAVTTALKASNLDPAQMQSPSPPVFTTSQQCTGFVESAGCGATGAACVQLPVQLLTTAQGGGECGISVYFQYPFKFWLPFTSFNNQQILLTASARVRIETR